MDIIYALGIFGLVTGIGALIWVKWSERHHDKKIP